MADVIDIVSRVATPQPATDPTQPATNVIEQLESLLERARSGKVRAIAVAFVSSGNVVSTAYSMSDDTNHHELMAAISYLQHRFAQSRTETSVPVEAG